MKLIVTALVGVFLFIGAAGVSYMFIFPPEIVPEDEMAEVDADPHEFPPTVDDAEKQDAMPVAMRPETPLTVEALMELAQSIMEKEKVLFDSRQQIKKDEKRVKFLFEDLKREQDELKAFAKMIDEKIIQAEEAVKVLKLEKQSAAEQTEALNSIEKRTGTIDEVADNDLNRRVKVVKSWFKDLDPEQAAKYLKEFAERGDMEFVAKLLDSLEDRRIAKVLAAFDDAPLVAQIVDTFTNKDKAAEILQR
jgi:aminopeptidase N